MCSGVLEVYSLTDDGIRELISLAETFPDRLEVLGVQPDQVMVPSEHRTAATTSYMVRIWWGDLVVLAALKSTLMRCRGSSYSGPHIH